MIAALKALWSATSGGNRLALILAAVLAVAALCGLAAWRGYTSGESRADDRWGKVMAVREAEWASARAEVERTARELAENATRRGQAVERRFLAARRTIEAQQAELTRHRILEVSRADVHCPGPSADPGVGPEFGPDWVREFNAAFGLACRAPVLPDAAPGPHGAAAAAQAAGPGLLHGVTPADLLAWARDAGGYCRDLRARLAHLVEWAEGR